MAEVSSKKRLPKFLRITALVLSAIVLIVICLASVIWISIQAPSVAVPRQGVTLSDVTIVNPGAERRHVATLSVRGATIATISDQEGVSPTGMDDSAETRFAGAYVLPGLIDMHTHYLTRWDRELCSILYLMYGVTTVREMGNFDDSIFETRRMIEGGDFPGPRIFTGGKIVDGSPPSWPGSAVVTTTAEADAVVDALAAQGADFIKVYSRLSGESLNAVREAATRHSLPVVGHIPFTVPLEEAGVEDVQHLLGVWPNYYWKNWGTLEQERIDEVVRICVEQGIAQTPTIVVWDRTADVFHLEYRESPTARLLPRYYRQIVWHPETGMHSARGAHPEELASLRGAIPTMKNVVGALHKAGVRIHVGTDTLNPVVVPGVSFHEELQHLREAGLSAEEVWIAATRASGESLGEPMLGTIQEGAPADLLIFREDPTLNLSALSSLEAVIAGGRLYTKEDLDKAYALHREHFEGYIYDKVSMAICRSLLNAASEKAN